MKYAKNKSNLKSTNPFLSRREFFIRTAVAAPLIAQSGCLLLTQEEGETGAPETIAESPLAVEAEQEDRLPPISEPHFPDQLHLFVWRNWELANADGMARVLGTREENILEIGASMGLPPKPQLTEDQLRRIYITVIRQNWHVLPETQIIDLLGWTRERFEFTLKEDDFLEHKLGRIKPEPKALTYQPPSPEARRKAAKIKEALEKAFATSLHQDGEAPFAFVEELSRIQYASYRSSTREASTGEVNLRGWTIIRPARASDDLVLAIEQFRDYLNQTFQSRVKIQTASGALQENSFLIQLDPELSKLNEAFEVDIMKGQVRLAATGLAGLRHGLYRLQDRMELSGGPFLPLGVERGVRRLSPAYLYSYFALYGDPLIEEEIDPFPEGYLHKLARLGVNGVWLQGILRNLAPSDIFSEFGDGWQTRLSRLKMLVDRAARYGIKVFLYMNEPRAMSEEFFTKYPQIKGAHRPPQKLFAMCTTVPAVRKWISRSLAHIFREVPGLGGIFTISMSENLTNCFSKGTPQYCPRCQNRHGWEVIAELHEAFVRGIRASSQDAEVIAWDWGWGFDWVQNGAEGEKVIRHLPPGVKLLSISEWDQPVERGGFKTEVGEYSISVVGPGPRAKKHWTIGRQMGIEPLAKVQLNSTWEISAVPYIPVLNLIEEHMEELLKTGIKGMMLSWTVGGYPSPNLEVAKDYYYWPTRDRGQVLQRIAQKRYGARAVPNVLKAWRIFSDAFQEFPYGIRIYVIPTQHGPSNLLRLQNTGYPSGMILFPYDDWKNWVKPYPPDIVQDQFQKMASKWKTGIEEFRQAITVVPESQREEARKDLGIAETCYLHFQSVANQLQFYFLRDEYHKATEKSAVARRMIRLTENEIELARRLYTIARQDSRIGFEATNHYYYRPLDLAEKVLNCRQIIEQLEKWTN